MGYNTYRTLQDLNNSFISAVSEISGIGSFYMIDESEINKLKSINYPTCILEIPNSSVSNVNAAWEDYELSLFILQPEPKTVSDYGSIAYYDSAVSLFKELINKLLQQRAGDYVMQKDSIEIERLSNFGNDNNIGVRVSFILTMPSIINVAAEPTVEYPPAVTYTTNLYGYWSTLYNISRTDNTFSWNSYNTPRKHVNKINGQEIPRLVNNKLIFDNQASVSGGVVNGSDVECLKINNLSFTNESFSVFFKMYHPESHNGDDNVIFNIGAPGDSNNVQISINSDTGSGNDGFVRVKYKVDGVQDVLTLSEKQTIGDVTPLHDANSLGFFGIVNDAVNDSTRVYIGSSVYTISDHSCQHVFSYSTFYIACSVIEAFDFYFEGGTFTFSELLIYDEAVSDSNVTQIRTDLIS